MGAPRDVREANRGRVLRVVWGGGSWTKHEVAARTGLSVPTCNTILNELAAEGAVEGAPRPTGRRGRTATAYRANELHEPLLLVSFDRDRGPRRHLRVEVVSVLGRVLDSVDETLDQLDYDVLLARVREVAARRPEVADVAVGTPSLAEEGVVRTCDVGELEGEPLVRRLGRDLGRPVHLENDMHLKAYGRYRMAGDPDEVVTLANFPEHVLPGTATVHRGMVVTGARQFAGMIGLLPYGMGREEYLARLERPGGIELAARGLAAVIVVANPSTVVCTGSLVGPDGLPALEGACARLVPAAYLPRFEWAASLDAELREGMRHRLLDARTAADGRDGQ